MSDHEPTASDKLRSAADHMDDAQVDLETAIEEAPDEGTEAVIREMEGVADRLSQTMRELAINSEVVEGTDE